MDSICATLGKFSSGYANRGKNSKINKFKVVFLKLIMQDN
jgi:hypothetical protein